MMPKTAMPKPAKKMACIGTYGLDLEALLNQVDDLDLKPPTPAEIERGETVRTLTWERAGPVLRQLVGAMYVDLRAMVAALPPQFGLRWGQVPRAAIRSILVADLQAFDDVHGWDWPRMDEATEDQFLRFIAEQEADSLMHADAEYGQ